MRKDAAAEGLGKEGPAEVVLKHLSSEGDAESRRTARVDHEHVTHWEGPPAKFTSLGAELGLDDRAVRGSISGVCHRTPLGAVVRGKGGDPLIDLGI